LRVYTLGTAQRKSYDFTRILYKYGIQVLFDIRANPETPEEHFCRGPLEQLCSTNGINYVYLGNELGHALSGRQPAAAEWLKNETVQQRIALIAQKVPLRVCCILCTELTPERCHRRLIGEQLARQGIEVVHLLSENSVWQPRPPRPRR